MLDTTPDNLAGTTSSSLRCRTAQSAPIAAEELGADTLVIDCGSRLPAHRSRAMDEVHTGSEHAEPGPTACRNLPGQRAKLAATKQIAGTGCYPTNVTLSLLPALTHGLITGRTSPSPPPPAPRVPARQPSRTCLGSELFNSMSAYGVGGMHRHVPEICRISACSAPPIRPSASPRCSPRCRAHPRGGPAPISGVARLCPGGIRR